MVKLFGLKISYLVVLIFICVLAESSIPVEDYA